MWRSNSIIIVSVLSICSVSLLAQDSDLEHREWEASGFIGSAFTSNAQLPILVDGSSGSTRPVGIRHASGYEVGGRLTDNFTPDWSGAMEYSFAHQDLRFTNLSPELQTLSLTQYVHRLSYNIGYLPLPPWRRLRPYAEAGAGTALYFLPESSKEMVISQGFKFRDSWVFLINCGGGFKYLVKDQFGLTFDVKDRLTGIPSYGLPNFAHGIAQTWQVSFGLAYQWDE